MTKNNEKAKAQAQAYRFLSRRDYFSSELKQKLLKKNFKLEIVEEVIADLKNRGYIDDPGFADSYVRHCKDIRRIGPHKIQYELKKKKVSEDIIRDALKKYTYWDELENIRCLAERRKNFDHSRNKIYAYLKRKGYSTEAVKKGLSELFPEKEE